MSKVKKDNGLVKDREAVINAAFNSDGRYIAADGVAQLHDEYYDADRNLFIARKNLEKYQSSQPTGTVKSLIEDLASEKRNPSGYDIRAKEKKLAQAQEIEKEHLENRKAAQLEFDTAKNLCDSLQKAIDEKYAEIDAILSDLATIDSLDVKNTINDKIKSLENRYKEIEQEQNEAVELVASCDMRLEEIEEEEQEELADDLITGKVTDGSERVKEIDKINLEKEDATKRAKICKTSLSKLSPQIAQAKQDNKNFDVVLKVVSYKRALNRVLPLIKSLVNEFPSYIASRDAIERIPNDSREVSLEIENNLLQWRRNDLQEKSGVNIRNILKVKLDDEIKKVIDLLSNPATFGVVNKTFEKFASDRVSRFAVRGNTDQFAGNDEYEFEGLGLSEGERLAVTFNRQNGRA